MEQYSDTWYTQEWSANHERYRREREAARNKLVRDYIVRRARHKFEAMTTDFRNYAETAMHYANHLTTVHHNAGIEKVKVIPDQIKPHYDAVFSNKGNLISAAWISLDWCDEDMDYILEKFMPADPESGRDDIWRLSNSEWSLTFNTDYQKLEIMSTVTVPSGHIESPSGAFQFVGYKQVGQACNFIIHGDREAFFQDMLMMKISM